MQAGIELIREKDCPHFQRMHHRADEAEPDPSSKRLVFGIEFDLSVDASMRETNPEFFEGWALLAVGIIIHAGENAHGATQPLAHDRIERMLLRTGHSEVGGLKE